VLLGAYFLTKDKSNKKTFEMGKKLLGKNQGTEEPRSEEPKSLFFVEKIVHIFSKKSSVPRFFGSSALQKNLSL